MAFNLLFTGRIVGMLVYLKQARQDAARRLKLGTAGWLAVSFVCSLLASSAQAQETGTTNTPPKAALQGNDNGKGNDNGNNGKAKGKSKPTVAERPQVIGAKGAGSGEKGKPDRPGNPNPTEPAEVTSLVNKFQSAREEFLAAQKELNLRKKEASEEQRAVLREKVKEALDKWKEEHKQFVEEQKERSKEIKQELHPDLGKVVDGAKGNGGGGRDR